MSKLVVCVILATYNGATYIDAQLASLQNQTHRPDLLVLRDDGSSDATVVLVREWTRMAHIELIEIPAIERLGPARSFLTALTATVPADIFLFCDQDDVWLPHKVESAVRILSQIDTAQPHLVATRLQVVDQDLQFMRLSPIPNYLSFGSAVCENVLTGCTMAFNSAFRNLLIRELPGQVEMHDWWCYLLASGAGSVTFDPAPSLMYRQHSTNAIGAGTRGWAKVHERMTAFAGQKSEVRSRQLREFARLHMNDLRPDAKALLGQLLAAKISIAARLIAVFSAPIRRQNILSQLTTRISLLANRF